MVLDITKQEQKLLEGAILREIGYLEDYIRQLEKEDLLLEVDDNFLENTLNIRLKIDDAEDRIFLLKEILAKL